MHVDVSRTNCTTKPRFEIGHFPVLPGPLFQNEGRFSAFDMKIIFHSHANKTHFHKKGCAASLILKKRVFGTRDWPIVKLGSFGYINSQSNRVEKYNQAQRMQMRRLLFAVEPLCKIFVWRQHA